MSPLHEVFGRPFRSDGFVPRRLSWPGWLVWEHVTADVLIGLAWLTMAWMIWQLGCRAGLRSSRGLLWAFVGFLGLASLAQFLDALALFVPLYAVSGHVLLATGVAAGGTLWALRRTWPTLSSMNTKSPDQFEAELEARVRDRTAELEAAYSALKLSEGQLRHARDQALEATRAKSACLANMSHEIRTPMNGIIGMVELIRETPLDLDQRDHLSTIQKRDALLNVINDILDLSKIEAGKLSLVIAPFDLRALLGEVTRLLSPRARQKGLRLVDRVAPEVPARLAGDPVRLRQILTNLVGNAVTFTDRGEVSLEAGIVAIDDARLTLRLDVRDTGVGIPREHHARIFESFNQVEGPSTQKQGGTGLGLTISRSLVELMGGRIEVESEPGKGSRFSIELVLARAPLDETAGIGPAASDGEDMLNFEAPLHVLLVEDHEVNRRVATEMIERLGCRVDAVANGEAAVAALEGMTYDVVLMDIQLPGIDGLTATAEIRRREAGTGRHQPIVALTANAMRGDRERCLDAGMDDYLAKPLRTQTLRETLRSWGKTAAGPASAHPARPFDDSKGGFQFDHLNECFEGNSALIAEVLDTFIRSTPDHIISISAAVEATDGTALEREVHRLKGACNTIGDGPMAAACQQLLTIARQGELADARSALDSLVNRWKQIEIELTSYLDTN